MNKNFYRQRTRLLEKEKFPISRKKSERVATSKGMDHMKRRAMNLNNILYFTIAFTKSLCVGCKPSRTLADAGVDKHEGGARRGGRHVYCGRLWY